MKLSNEQLEQLFDVPPWEWKDGTRDGLLAILEDPTGDLKATELAAKLAGDETAINEKLALALLEVAKNAKLPDTVRSHAADGLGPLLEISSIRDSDDLPVPEKILARLQEGLLALYRDEAQPKLVRRLALESSVRREQDWHAEAVRKTYASGDRDWQLSALFAMHYCFDSDDGLTAFGDEIIACLQSDDPELKREALLAAAATQHAPAWKTIAGLVSNDSPKPILLAAIEAAMALKPKRSGELLAKLKPTGDEELDTAVQEAREQSDTFDEGFDDDEDEA